MDVPGDRHLRLLVWSQVVTLTKEGSLRPNLLRDGIPNCRGCISARRWEVEILETTHACGLRISEPY